MKLIIALILIATITFLIGCNPTQALVGTENYQLLEPKIFAERLEEYKDRAVIVDVRTPMEYKKNHISGAKNINIISSNFNTNISKLDSMKPVFVYCQTAHRSGYAAKTLSKLGYKVYELEGGLKAWTEQGF